MKTAALADLSELIDYGVTATANPNPVGPKFLRITDIQNGAVEWETVPYCEAANRKLAASRLRAGDIVFARTGATTGKSFLIRHCPDNAVFASYLIRVRPNAQIDSAFLAQFFKSSGYWEQISAKAVGAAQPGVNASKLQELEVPLPTPAEQRRIAAILDQADALRAMRQAALAQLDEMARAVFMDMFGNPLADDHKFPTVPLSAVVDPTRAITYGILMPGPDYPGGVSYVRVVDMVNGTVNLSTVRKTSPTIARQYERSKIRSGDLLISIRGHVGRVAVTPPDLDGANITQDTARLAVTGVDPLFLKGLLVH